MTIEFTLNGKNTAAEISPDDSLYTVLRSLGVSGVKRGCDTTNCGLCTVLLDGKPVLSCSVPAPRAQGKQVQTIEAFEAEAAEIGRFLAARGADQCGFCNPGLIISVIAMSRELISPTEADVKAYLSGNLCRCTGYVGQNEAIMAYIKSKEAKK